MIFNSTEIQGVWVLYPESARDARGHFTRTYCAEEFRVQGIDPRVAQASVSYSARAGTVRGLHLQREPHGETKLVRCTRGEVFDVALDLRTHSPTFGRHHAVRLSPSNGAGFVIPPGVAHGFMTLEADTDVSYQMSVAYAPAASGGVRWDDPALGIDWPMVADPVVSRADLGLPLIAEWTRLHGGEIAR